MSSTDREAKIIWMNWKEMFLTAEEREDDTFFDLSAILARKIEVLCGSDNLLEWAGEELCEDRGFSPTVMYHVSNRVWPWDVMMNDLKRLSAEFQGIVFQITFIEGSLSGKTYLLNGKTTAVLYNGEDDSLTIAY